MPGPSVAPSGTVAFLFTDVEGSTRMWEQHQRAMTVALGRHDELLRAAIESRGGYVFSTAGDAFSAAFATSRAAVAAAVAAQRELQAEPWPEGVTIRVRMGVHVGVADERDGDYFGPTVNRTARLMGLAHGDQVLVSLAVEDSVRDDLPDGVKLQSLGSHVLRGLSSPEGVFQVIGVGLAAEFPPLISSLSALGNLPLGVSSFVGRVGEVKRLGAALGQNRLVSLVGPGGVGKTRLAIETAAAVAGDFPDGVWFVDLAAVSDPEAVVHALASSLALRPDEGTNLLESVAESMADRRALVLLDGCEHVVEAAAAVALALGRRDRALTVLVTSRQRLSVAGEQVWPVNPLDPALEAVDLFVERALAANPDFRLGDDDLPAIAELCARLDGIPLAVELAAGRARSMTVAELAARLEDRFRWLRVSHTGGADARQTTMAATVEWSYRLLTADERAVFDRLTVFAGSFDAAAAGAVCADERLDRLDVVDIIQALVDRSMVVAEQNGSEGTRFSLLETMRHFGRQRLAERNELDARLASHLAHFRAIAIEAGGLYEGSGNEVSREMLEREWANLRAAVQHALGTQQLEPLEEILQSIQFLAMFTLRHECFEWARQTTALPGAGAGCWGLAAWGASMDGRFEECSRLATRGRELVADNDPTGWTCWFLSAMGDFHSGRPEQAWATVQVLMAAHVDHSRRGVAAGMACFIAASVRPNEVDELAALARHEAQLASNPAFSAFAKYLVCRAMFTLGRLEESAIATARVLELTRIAGNATVESAALMNLALCTPEDGSDVAGERWSSTLTHLHRARNWTNIWIALEALSCDWAERGNIEAAATLAHQVNREGARSPSMQQRRQARDAILEQHADLVGAISRQANLNRDDVVAYALRHLARATG